ncbi:hypothetical protein [Natrialba hulunbeirensis]|nr:hypothetical protein [Natrialba hulunbeirensis]
MTEKARTDRPSVSTRSSQSSNPAKQTWKISDGPADENLQRIADDIYGSSHETTTRQRSRSGSAVADNAGVTVDRSSDPKVTTTLQLPTLDQNDPLPAADYTPHGLTFSILLILGIPGGFLFTLLSQSVISSVLLTLALATIAYPFLYIHNKPVSEDLNRINELIGPYEKKKREINNMIEQNGDVPDKDINDLRSLHGEISTIVSRRNEGHFNSQFVDQVAVTTTDIKRLERGNVTPRT